jgi:hypothetical protein
MRVPAKYRSLYDQVSGNVNGYEKLQISRAFDDGHGWARTSDLSRVKRALSH